MSVLSTEEYLKKGHQIDLDMTNLDTSIKGVAQVAPNAIPSSELMTWTGVKNAWDDFYHKNIESVPLLPWQGSEDLDLWLSRFTTWSSKNQKWALLSGNKLAHDRAAAMPESVAVIEYKEEVENKKHSATPVWVWMVLGTGLLGALGYSIASVARLGGR